MMSHFLSFILDILLKFGTTGGIQTPIVRLRRSLPYSVRPRWYFGATAGVRSQICRIMSSESYPFRRKSLANVHCSTITIYLSIGHLRSRPIPLDVGAAAPGGRILVRPPVAMFGAAIAVAAADVSGSSGTSVALAPFFKILNVKLPLIPVL